jgi:hypothetical protein
LRDTEGKKGREATKKERKSVKCSILGCLTGDLAGHFPEEENKIKKILALK